MGKRILLILALVLIFRGNSRASDEPSAIKFRRINITSSLKLNREMFDKVADGNSKVEAKILNELKAREIVFDSNTTISIHQEESVINFSCFDCLIRELPATDETTLSAWNGQKSDNL